MSARILGSRLSPPAPPINGMLCECVCVCVFESPEERITLK